MAVAVRMPIPVPCVMCGGRPFSWCTCRCGPNRSTDGSRWSSTRSICGRRCGCMPANTRTEGGAVTVDLAGVCSGPGPCDTTPFGAGKNWVNSVGGLPLYIRAIAKALQRSGHSESSAIATAVATVKRWAAGGGGVSAETRARAAAAVAEWERKKVQSHAFTAAPPSTVDLTQTIASTNDSPQLTVPARMTAAKQGKALPGGRFPIRNTDELAKAVRAVGRAKGDHAAVRRFIRRRAKELNAEHLVPDSWKADGTVDMAGVAATPVDLAWNEAAHPRAPKGAAGGGRFAGKNASSSAPPSNMAGNVRDFQRRNHLPVTGIVDTVTAAKIRATLTAKAGGGKKIAKAKTAKAAKAARAATRAQKRSLATHVATVNAMTPPQRAAARAQVPVPPTGYVWTPTNTLKRFHA